MTSIVKVIEPEIIQFSDTDKVQAEQTRAQISAALSFISSDELNLARNYVQLGSLLLQVRNNRYWLLWKYSSFGSYLKTVQLTIDRSRSLLYQVMSVHERLLPAGVSEKDLVEMGVSKAVELSRWVKSTGKNPTKKLLKIAVNPKVHVIQLREELFKDIHGKSPFPGKFFDLGGFYATADEKQEIESVFELAEKIDPIISQITPDWAKRKEIILRMVREFRATWEPILEQEKNK